MFVFVWGNGGDPPVVCGCAVDAVARLVVALSVLGVGVSFVVDCGEVFIVPAAAEVDAGREVAASTAVVDAVETATSFVVTSSKVVVPLADVARMVVVSVTVLLPSSPKASVGVCKA